MTVITIGAAAYMRRILSARYNAVMAGATGAEHLRMVNRVNRRPDIRIMAVLANIRRLDMRKVLANGFGTIVATDTIAGDAHVIEIGW